MPVISYADAVAAITRLQCAQPSISHGLQAANAAALCGRVVAEPIRLQRDQPPFDRATMDGYACACSSASGIGAGLVLPVIATRHAGGDSVAPKAGQAIRIMTGAVVPPGCTVVPLELTDRGMEIVTITTTLSAGANVARQGEDGRAGAIIAPTGTRLTPIIVAAAAMAGATAVTVYRQPTVAIITTGDEVGSSAPAGIVDSNGPLVVAWLSALGISAAVSHVGDDAMAMDAALAAAWPAVDLIITTGGVSAGERDRVPAAVGSSGAMVDFHGVDIQPGKPVLMAHRSEKILLGLPGNPVSVLAGLQLFALPLMSRMWPGFDWPWMEWRLAEPARSKQRPLFLPAWLDHDGLHPVAWNGSGDLLAAATGDGLIALPANCQRAAGELIRFLPYVGSRMGQRALSTRQIEPVVVA